MVSVLFKASESGDVSKVSEILTDATPVDIEIKDHTGATPLIVAVKNNHVEVVKALLSAGADPLNPSSQGPPASHTSNPEILSLLTQTAPRPPAGPPSYPSPYGQHHQQQQPHLPYPGGGPNGPVGEMYPPYGFSGGGYSPYPYGMYGMGHPQMMMMGGMGGIGHPAGLPLHMMQQQQHQHQQQSTPEGQESQGGAVEEEKKEKIEGPEGDAGSIPPPDISKTIPCKFFPQCKYGSECAFQHPPQPFNTLPPPPPPPMYPHPDYNMPPFAPPFYQFPPNFYPGPPGSMPMVPPHMMSPHPAQYRSHRYVQHNVPDFNENAFVVVPPPLQPPPVFAPSALAPPFAPSFMPASQEVSPPAIASTTRDTNSSPPAESTQATTAQTPSEPPSTSAAEPGQPFELEVSASPVTPSQALSSVIVGGARGSVESVPFTGPRRFGPFGGPTGFKKWAGKPTVKWTGGNAPPCSFFLNNRCRNSELCRFPHIRPDGVDCRLPGVIDGSVAAAPISVIPKSVRPSTSFSTEHESLETGLESSLESLRTEDVDASSTSSPPLSTDASTFVPRGPSVFTPAFVPKSTANAFIVQPHPTNTNRSQFPFSPMHHNPLSLPRSSPSTRPASPSSSTFAQMTQQQQLALMRNPRSLSATPTSRRSDAAFSSAPQKVPSSDDFPALGASSMSASTAGNAKELGGSAVMVSGWKTAALAKSRSTAGVAKKDERSIDVKKKAGSSSGSVDVMTTSDNSSDDDAVLINASRNAPSAQNGKPFPIAARAPAASPAVALRA